MKTPILYIFSGLPGTGKSTLAKELAKNIESTYIRIDTIEQALTDSYDVKVQDEGYRLAYRVAADNLKIGNNVISDSCNPIEVTRNEWNNVALDANARFINIEIICSIKSEHRRRVESRVSEVQGLEHPSWEQVENREYHPWVSDRIVIDTAGKSIASCICELLEKLREA